MSGSAARHRLLQLLENRHLQVHERFISLQGEGGSNGEPFYFIRLSGCDLRCHWCDTKESWSGGEKISIRRIIEEMPSYPVKVLITGGEPLLQREGLMLLIQAIPDFLSGVKIYLETGGHHSLAGIPDHVRINMDVKLSGSGESEHDFPQNFSYLKREDEVKFVVKGREDFLEALDIIREHNLQNRFQVFLSPVSGSTELRDLASWILEEKLNVRLQNQLHKVIWGPDSKGV